ncbi:metalloendopeptidase [Caerostris darwini]|uniref:Metalloendopeptidase n=1 Tax=Caerostris darwini TaxID=1538125 RepID=A0AAV4WKR0_9ARAC|nr:metalloendopeptidase [Caerostris darwini]
MTDIKVGVHESGTTSSTAEPDYAKSIQFFNCDIKAVVYSSPAKIRDPMINEGLFEGDIVGIDPNQDRNAVPRDSMRWTNGVVPYEVDESLCE